MTPVRLRRRHGARRVPLGRTTIVIQAIVVLGVLVYLLSHEYVQLPLIGPSHYVIHAEFTNAGGLDGRNHSPVQVAGVPLGRVVGVSYRNGLAVATLELPSSVQGEVFNDARVRVIPRSVLQDLMVDITPGSPKSGALRDGGTIAASQTSSTVAFDQLIDTLDPTTRAEVQILLGQLSTGLAGRAGSLRAGLQKLGTLVDTSTRVTSQLSERRALLSKTVTDLDLLLTTLGNRTGDLRTVIADGRRVLSSTAANSAQIAGTIDRLPSTLAALGGAMGNVTSLAPSLDKALSTLRPFARRLPAALDALHSYVPSGSGLVRDLTRFVTGAGAPVRQVRTVLSELGPTSRALHKPVADLLPILAPINTDRAGVGEVGDNFSGVFSTNDANGPILRGLGFFESFSPVDLGFPAGASGATLLRAKADSVKALTDVCLHSNPVACLVRYLIPGLPGAVAPLVLTPTFPGAHG